MPKLRKDLGWLVKVDDEYGTKKIRANIVIPQPDGSMNYVDSFYWHTAIETRDFADLTVSSYLGELEYAGTGERDRGKVWGLGYYYDAGKIEKADRARSIARMLTNIEKALHTANADLGYIDDADFPGYLARIGRAIGVTTYYVRNSPKRRDMTGQDYRQCDVPDLAYWVRDLAKLATQEPGELAQRIRQGY
jgi:hypothetical protein